MSRPKQKPQHRRHGGKPSGPKPYDVWAPAPPLPEARPVRRVDDPVVITALLRSLGDPPLSARGLPVEEYLCRAVESAARMAKGLALSAGLLIEPEDDEP